MWEVCGYLRLRGGDLRLLCLSVKVWREGRDLRILVVSLEWRLCALLALFMHRLGSLYIIESLVDGMYITWDGLWGKFMHKIERESSMSCQAGGS